MYVAHSFEGLLLLLRRTEASNLCQHISQANVLCVQNILQEWKRHLCCIHVQLLYLQFSKNLLVCPNKRSWSDHVLLTLKQTMQKKLIYEGIKDHWQYMNAAMFLEQKCNEDIKKLNKNNATIIIWRSVPTSLDLLVSLEFLHCPELFHKTNKLEVWVKVKQKIVSFLSLLTEKCP